MEELSHNPGNCPECGKSLQGKDIRGHSLSHYPVQIPFPDQNIGAVQRQKQLYELARKAGQ